MLVKDARGGFGQYFYDADGKRIKKIVSAMQQPSLFIMQSEN